MDRYASFTILATALVAFAGCLGAGGSEDASDATGTSASTSTTPTSSPPATSSSPPATNETPPPDPEPEPTIQRVSLNLTGTADAPAMFYIDPDEVNATKDVTLNLTVRNADQAGTTGLNHSFTIPNLDVEIDVLVPGASATVQFVVTRTGSFDYYCAEPGHKDIGMKGKLNVVAASA